MMNQSITVGSVSAQGRSLSDHAAYIEAVCASLVRQSIGVTEIALVRDQGCREAVLTLRPDVNAFTLPLPDETVAFWDEIAGWSLTVYRAAGNIEYHEGTRVLPDPDIVATWAVAVLSHPASAVTRGLTWFRDEDIADPAFEAELARY